MSTLLTAVKKTKIYARKYGQILSDNQLYLRLISPKEYDFEEIKDKGRQDSDNNGWHRKVEIAKEFTNKYLLGFLGIKMVGITGSVAAEAVKENEDIDLLIVTKKDELWWWRLYLRFYIWWNKIPHRKYKKKERANELCFNLWLDTANLEIPVEKRNLKNATDLILMKVILNKENTYKKFLEANVWARKYLATGYRERIKISREVDEKINSKNEEKNSFIKKIINRILFWGQYLYMWSKVRKKLKYIKSGQAFFHEGT